MKAGLTKWLLDCSLVTEKIRRKELDFDNKTIYRFISKARIGIIIRSRDLEDLLFLSKRLFIQKKKNLTLLNEKLDVKILK